VAMDCQASTVAAAAAADHAALLVPVSSFIFIKETQ